MERFKAEEEDQGEVEGWPDHVGPMSPFSGLWLSWEVLSREGIRLDVHLYTFALTSGQRIGE